MRITRFNIILTISVLLNIALVTRSVTPAYAETLETGKRVSCQAEADEADNLASCLNQSDSMASAYEICVESQQFKFKTSRDLAQCVTRSQIVTDPVASAFLIEDCYE